MSALTPSFARIAVAVLLLGVTSVALLLEIAAPGQAPSYPGRYRLAGALAFVGACAALLLPTAYTWLLAQAFVS